MFNFLKELLFILIANSILNPTLLYLEIMMLILIIGIIVLFKTAPKDKNVSKKKEIPGKLTPIVVDKKEYSGVWKKLERVLDDDDITNIAITGEYGTGKSSFLKSFFRDKDNKKYKFISVPNFIKKEENAENLEVKLEESILNQLLDEAYPDSNIRRVKKISKKTMTRTYRLTYISCIVVESIFFINKMGIKKNGLDLNFTNMKYNILAFLIVLLNILLINLIRPIFKKLIHTLSKVALHFSTPIGSVDVETGNENGKISNLFILYKDEIIYYLKESNLEYIIFEDIDRFKDLKTFQNLRDLNKNINNSYNFKDRKVKFIYTFSETIYGVNGENEKITKDINEVPKLKAKFFDFVISLPPFSSYVNGANLFKRELEKYDELKKLTEDTGILLGVGSFINDKREIINIVADMDSYKRVMDNNKSVNLKKLLGAMIYKNLFINDFRGFYNGNSKLQYYLNRINSLYSETLKIFFREESDLAINDMDKERGPSSPATPEYIEELLDKYSDEKSIKYSLPLAHFILKNIKIPNKYNEDSRLIVAINFCYENKVLNYLIRQGLIDEKILNYLFPLKIEEDLSIEDNQFLQNILTHSIPIEDTRVENPEKFLRVISMIKDAEYQYIFSSNILLELIKRIVKQSDRQVRKNLSDRSINILRNISNIRWEGEDFGMFPIHGKTDFLNAVICDLMIYERLELMEKFLELSERNNNRSKEYGEESRWVNSYRIVEKVDEQQQYKNLTQNLLLFILKYWKLGGKREAILGLNLKKENANKLNKIYKKLKSINISNKEELNNIKGEIIKILNNSK